MKFTLKRTALAIATLALAAVVQAGEPTAKPDAVKPATAKASEAKDQPAAKPADAAKKDEKMAKDASPVVVMKTSMGVIKIKLNQEKAPVTVENFLKYVDQKFFDGTIFHRVMDGFMIQGGGFSADLTQKKTLPPIKLESANGLSNRRGTIAMARTGDPNSATAQFFINVVDNGKLDHHDGPGGDGYAVFGEVTEGMDVVDKIKGVATGSKNGMGNVPNETVTIESVRKAE